MSTRKRKSVDNKKKKKEESEEEEEVPKTKKTAQKKKMETDVSSLEAICEDEANYFKILSWNVNGLNAFLKKPNFKEYIEKENPNVICLGETKGNESKPIDLKKFLKGWDENFKVYWSHSTSKKGYSGNLFK